MGEPAARGSGPGSWQSGEIRVDADASFLRLTLPFSLPNLGSGYESLVETVFGAVDEAGSRLWSELDLPVDALLPHCASHLNCWQPDGSAPVESGVETAHYWTLATRQGGQADRTSSGVSGTPGLFDGGRRWFGRHRGQWFEFLITDLLLTVFRLGIGFLTVEVRATSDSPDAWLNAASWLRFIGTDSTAWEARSTPRLFVTGDADVFPFFEPANDRPAELESRFDLSPSEHVRTGALGDLFSWVLDRSLPGLARRPTLPPGETVPFACFFVRSGVKPVGDRSTSWSVTPVAADFAYRARRFFHAKQPVVVEPDEAAVSGALRHDYAAGQETFYSLDGGGFLAIDAPATRFFAETLPIHLRRYRFFNFLFVMHQRLVLMEISGRIARSWTTKPPRLPTRSVSDVGPDELAELEAELADRTSTFEDLRDELFEFLVRGHFVQLMHSQSRHDDYRLWQEALQVELFLEEVDSELREIHSALSLRYQEVAGARATLAEAERRAAREQALHLEARDARAQTALTYAVSAFAIVSLVLAFLGVNIDGVTQEGVGLGAMFALTAGALVAGALGIVGVHWWIHRDTGDG